MHGLEKLISFLSRHFGPPRLFLVVAAWILLLGAWGSVARNLLPVRHDVRGEIPLELRAPLYAKFDSGWYLSIMEWGYGPPPPAGRPSSHAFFPLYPWTAKVLRDTFAMDGFHAGLVVSYLCLFLAASLFLREGIQRLGERSAWRAVVFFLLFPTSFFYASVYAEPMTLLFALLAFREARAARTGRAVLFGALAGLSRAFAVTLGPPLFLASLLAPRVPRPESRVPSPGLRVVRALLIGAAPVVAVFGWIYGMGLAKGEPGLYFRSLEGWHRGAGALSGVALFFENAARNIEQAAWKQNPTLILDYAMVLAFIAIAVYQLVRRRWSDLAWTACAVAVPVSTGLSGGIPRFFALVYPVSYALAEATRNAPVARWVLWIVSGAALLWASARFVNWQWVA